MHWRGAEHPGPASCAQARGSTWATVQLRSFSALPAFALTCLSRGYQEARTNVFWSRKMPAAVCPRARIQCNLHSKHPWGLLEADGEAGG